MKRNINRRDFIKAAAALGIGAAALGTKVFGGALSKPNASPLRYEPTDEPQAPSRTLRPGNGSVVHVHADGALLSSWSFQPDYWNYVDQGAVDRMVDEGMLALTGRAELSEAWKSLVPNYQRGEVVAIKVSFNNGDKADETMIDANVQPVNAVIRGLKLAGVPERSIVVFDSQRPIRQRLRERLPSGVQVRDSSSDPWGDGSGAITFHLPTYGANEQRISREVVKAAYLINMPVLKFHGSAHVSMGLKNHYGTISDPGAIHHWTFPAGKYFAGAYKTYSPIVELNQHPQIAGKTILIVGDALFGGFDNNGDHSKPAAWRTFDNQPPKSLFFSRDPVAVDCVMCDVLSAELRAWEGRQRQIDPQALEHLALAERAGLGIYELGDPWKNTYSRISYRKINL